MTRIGKAGVLLFLLAAGPSTLMGEEVLASRKVSKAEFGARWPLTVEKGTIACVEAFKPKMGVVIFITERGKGYALNGFAKSRKFPAIEPIWRRDPDMPEMRVNIGPLIDAALELCR